jgi:hypothetical protein
MRKIYFAVAGEGKNAAGMPRPKPSPDLAPERATVSMPKKVARAGIKVVDPDRPEVRDFSALVTLALREYLERHHKGLIEQVAAELRALNYPERKKVDLAAAEPKPPDKTSRTPGAGPRHRVSA